MVGITSYGAYIPRYRLSRADIGKGWGSGGRGEKAVANFDEDSITMAVAAARDCLTETDPKTVDGLYFATTTSPYREKQAAATIAITTDLRRDTITTDFGGSLRAGASATRAAIDAVSSGSAKNVLVCAADMRLGAPNGPNEMAFGDGAGALLIGDSGVIATIEGTYSISDEIIDSWRSYEQTFVRSWEDRFAREYGYSRVTIEAVNEAMKRFGVTPQDISKFACYSPTARDIGGIARRLKFDLGTQVQNPLCDVVGNTGTPLAIMVLVAALEESKAGDRILFASYGDGCTVFLLRVTEEIEKARSRRGIKEHLASKAMLTSYAKYLEWREIIPTEIPQRPLLDRPSAVAIWRNRPSGFALHGSKCNKCGTAQYPPQRVCLRCHAKDDFEYYSFADKRGTLTTFSHDTLAVTESPPTTICVVDFPDGGRITCDMTDRDVEEVKVGMPVEMTFRKLRHIDGITNYWWKCKPIRG